MAVPVLAIKPAATSNPTFLAEMNFIFFSFDRRCV
jgi:hypothetical protein